MARRKGSVKLDSYTKKVQSRIREDTLKYLENNKINVSELIRDFLEKYVKKLKKMTGDGDNERNN